MNSKFYSAEYMLEGTEEKIINKIDYRILELEKKLLDKKIEGSFISRSRSETLEETLRKTNDYNENRRFKKYLLEIDRKTHINTHITVNIERMARPKEYSYVKYCFIWKLFSRKICKYKNTLIDVCYEALLNYSVELNPKIVPVELIKMLDSLNPMDKICYICKKKYYKYRYYLDGEGDCFANHCRKGLTDKMNSYL